MQVDETKIVGASRMATYTVTMETPRAEHSERDIRYDSFCYSGVVQRYPLFLDRYPALRSKLDGLNDKEQYDNPINPMTERPLCPLFHTIPDSSPPPLDIPVSTSEIHFEEVKSGISAKSYESELWKRSANRYDRRLLKVNCLPKRTREAKFQQAAEWVSKQPKELNEFLDVVKRPFDWDFTRDVDTTGVQVDLMVSYANSRKAKNYRQRQYMKKFAAFVDRIRQLLFGDEGSRMVYNASTKLQPNQSLKFKSRQGGGWVHDSSGLCPGLVIVDKADAIQPVREWGQVRCTGNVIADGETDFSTASRVNENIVPRMFVYQEAFSRNHPFTGESYAFTLAGPILRLWRMDAFSFSASLPVWLGHAKDQSREIVDMIAFLLDPDVKHYDSRPPPLKSVELLSLQGDIKASNWEEHVGKGINWERVSWDWEKDDNDNPIFEYLEIRDGLFGHRTTVITGNARLAEEAQTNAIWQTVVVKGLFLPKGVAYHEYRMLILLHGSDTPGSDKLDPSKPMADSISPFVIERLPRAVGMFADYIDFPWRSSKAGDKAVDHLEYQSLMTLCSIGERLAPNNPFEKMDRSESRPEISGLRGYGQLLKGVFECLWFAASKGIHYRDLNQGNVMWAMKDGQIIGYLIDFGNARYLNQPRQDSSPRGENNTVIYYFQSVWSIGAKKKQALYQEAVEYRDIAKPEFWAEEDELVTAALDAAMRATHRYIDDLESALYLISWQLRSFVEPGVPPTEARPEPILGFLDRETKLAEWNIKLRHVARGYTWAASWANMIQELAGTIQKSRNALMADLSAQPPDYMTQIENDCFYDCIQTIEQALLQLPEDGFE